MKLCHNCGQPLAEPIRNCPTCGTEVGEGLKSVDDYKILEVVHEGHASMVCRAVREGEETPVALRLFTTDSGFDETVARRFQDEFEKLRKLPEEWFVRHYSIGRSAAGMWYRVSEWLEAESWGDLMSSGRLQELDVVYDLFHRLAAILEGLHKSGHFIPHLILNDILILKGGPGRVDVKIDYKLSRILDPKMKQPVPMLQNLLECHPDIRAKRPLDFRSDVWSLGRIFTQVLAADVGLGDPVEIIKNGRFPKEISILIRSMLAEDPELRPRSMSEVEEALTRIRDETENGERISQTETAGEIKKLKRTIVLFTVMVGIAVGSFFFWYYDSSRRKDTVSLGEYAERYAASVAFVVVEYEVRVDDSLLYRRRTEGTAFLVDEEGFLLTNRHVACPWLEDDGVSAVVAHIRQAEKIPRFSYRMYLWFEGETAFNRLLGIGSGNELEDKYDLQSAYSTGGSREVKIAGVARLPVRTGQLVKSPLRDDFAVLKINRVPEGLQPLPLENDFASIDLKRLSPVITLGFPLGSQSQENKINVSVTRGHIRRTFENFFQVDTSIYRGNSGGPIIDERGKVIGIASAVATDVAVAPLPVITHLSDIGLVLPVDKAVEFVSELKTGSAKWNGGLDFDAAAKIRDIIKTAFSGNWTEAVDLADKSLESSDDLSLLMAAAMLHYCAGDFIRAGELFDRCISIIPDNYQARLMRALIDRNIGNERVSAQLTYLAALDWSSPGEFFGYLARVMQAAECEKQVLNAWNGPAEKGWLAYITGVVRLARGESGLALRHFRDAALASGSDEWPQLLSVSMLDHLLRGRRDALADLSGFREELLQAEKHRNELMAQMAPLIAQYEQAGNDPATRLEVLLKISPMEPENRKLAIFTAFYAAITSRWPLALDHAQRFLEGTPREDALRLAAGLLIPVTLEHMGRNEEARQQFLEFRDRVSSPWHRQIGETLLGERAEDALMESAGNEQEKILTASALLGFHAEANGDAAKAAGYYREALGTYLDNWLEYELARHRYVQLRKARQD